LILVGWLVGVLWLVGWSVGQLVGRCWLVGVGDCCWLLRGVAGKVEFKKLYPILFLIFLNYFVQVFYM
jgi:hypothetical protein